MLGFLGPMSGVEEFRLQDKSVTSEFLDGLVVAEKGVVLLLSFITLNLYKCSFANHNKVFNLILYIIELCLLVTIPCTLYCLPPTDLILQNYHCPPLKRIVLPQKKRLNKFIINVRQFD